MVERTDAVAREVCARGLPVLALLDTHDGDRPEPPDPPLHPRHRGGAASARYAHGPWS